MRFLLEISPNEKRLKGSENRGLFLRFYPENVKGAFRVASKSQGPEPVTVYT